jgi:sulfur carrier protein
MLVNDKEVKYQGNIKELLLSLNYSLERVAVLVNGELVKREDWEKFILKDDDYVEIVSLVGGG